MTRLASHTRLDQSVIINPNPNPNPNPKLNPPNPIAVIPAGNAGIQLPWMANRKAVKIQS